MAILSTPWDVVIFPSDSYQASSDDLKDSYPQPTVPIQLTHDIRLDLLDQDIADRVMDACEPMGLWPVKRPVRQYTQLYAYIREPIPQCGPYQWDPDQQLQTCLAISRLVHPISISLEYSARIFFDGGEAVRQIFPGPVNGQAARAYRVLPEWRDWLGDSEFEQLKKLLLISSLNSA
jgi:hypothetical protein